MFGAAISKCSILINKSIYMYVNLSEPSMIFRTRSVSLSLPWSGTQSRLGSSSSGTSHSFLLPRFRTLNRKILKSFSSFSHPTFSLVWVRDIPIEGIMKQQAMNQEKPPDFPLNLRNQLRKQNIIY